MGRGVKLVDALEEGAAGDDGEEERRRKVLVGTEGLLSLGGKKERGEVRSTKEELVSG